MCYAQKGLPVEVPLNVRIEGNLRLLSLHLREQLLHAVKMKLRIISSG